jgi:hypothetical protein
MIRQHLLIVEYSTIANEMTCLAAIRGHLRPSEAIAADWGPPEGLTT